MVEIGAFRVLMRTRLNIEPYFLLRPTKVGFIFIGQNSVEPKVTKSVVRVGSKIGFKAGFKELRPKPKLLNRGLWLSKVRSVLVVHNYT